MKHILGIFLCLILISCYSPYPVPAPYRCTVGQNLKSYKGEDLNMFSMVIDHRPVDVQLEVSYTDMEGTYVAVAYYEDRILGAGQGHDMSSAIERMSYDVVACNSRIAEGY